jgi:hypothetical protein
MIDAAAAAAAGGGGCGCGCGAGSGRMSPPPVDPAELSSLEGEVVNEAEDRRMIELLRAKVQVTAVQPAPPLTWHRLLAEVPSSTALMFACLQPRAGFSRCIDVPADSLLP